MNEEIAYLFRDAVPMEEVEDSLRLAEIAIRGLHGESRALLDVRTRLEPETRTCRVEAVSRVGRDLAVVFTALLRAQFGEAGFTVMRRGPR
jgi:hypothetical protein